MKWSFDENEHMHKVYTSCRDTNKIDDTFIKSVVRKCIGVTRKKIIITHATFEDQRLNTHYVLLIIASLNV